MADFRFRPRSPHRVSAGCAQGRRRHRTAMAVWIETSARTGLGAQFAWALALHDVSVVGRSNSLGCLLDVSGFPMVYGGCRERTAGGLFHVL